MTAADLIAACRGKGIELVAAPGRLRVRAPGKLDPALAEKLKHRKDAILAALTAVCQSCGDAVDDRRRCWRCQDRSCSACGKPTGSAFIELCTACGLAG